VQHRLEYDFLGRHIKKKVSKNKLTGLANTYTNIFLLSTSPLRRKPNIYILQPTLSEHIFLPFVHIVPYKCLLSVNFPSFALLFNISPEGSGGGFQMQAYTGLTVLIRYGRF
jgi:hypothetical protein